MSPLSTHNLHCQHILDYYRRKRDTAMRAFEQSRQHTYTAQIFANDFDFYYSAINCLTHADHWAGLINRMRVACPDLHISDNVNPSIRAF